MRIERTQRPIFVAFVGVLMSCSLAVWRVAPELISTARSRSILHPGNHDKVLGLVYIHQHHVQLRVSSCGQQNSKRPSTALLAMTILGPRSYFGMAHSPMMPGPPGDLPPFVDNTVVEHGSGYHARSMDV